MKIVIVGAGAMGSLYGGLLASSGEEVSLQVMAPLIKKSDRYYWRVRTYDVYQQNKWETSYAASKAFLRVLGESLWYELKDQGIDVLACSCGAVRTPGYAMAAGKEAPGTLTAEKVAKRALWALGGGPVVMPGFVNRLATIVMTRLVPKRTAIAILARSTRSLAQVRDTRSAS